MAGVNVGQCVRHCRKLRRGTHRANRFDLVLRRAKHDPRAAVDRIAADGVPNYFGEQRFGHGGGNVLLASRLFAGQRLKREQRSLALSAARSLIFNDVLDARVAAGNWNALLPGDIASLAGSNSHF